MPCTHPLRGYRDPASGKVRFPISGAFPNHPGYAEVSCGQCITCRLEHSRQWAVRIMHEAETHRRNCFLTLTYDDDHLPPDRSLRLDDFQRFVKRVRKRYGPGSMRYFHCGEYGALRGRPHYHAAVFGLDWTDSDLPEHRRKSSLFSNRGGNPVFTHPALEELWPDGLAVVGALTFESAAYVARYICDKVTGPAAFDHYSGRTPEYTTMSRRPHGIGKAWLDQFRADVYPRDEVIVRGKPARPPKYYDRLLELDDPNLHRQVRNRRLLRDRPEIPSAKLAALERATHRRLAEYARTKTEKD